jgi:phospholipid/cholesterol/gamma-HCH transport system ATP-binding protein
LIFGRILPEEGRVMSLGQDIAAIASEDELAAHGRRLGVVLRDGGLFSSWSVYDNIAVLLRNEHRLEEAQIRALVAEVLEEVGLSGQAALLPESLAIGHRKRGGIARAIVAEPELVIIDELEAGLDADKAALLAELIVHLHERRGGTILALTQDIRAAVLTADEIILLNRGRFVAAGTPAALQGCSNPHIRELLGSGGGGAGGGAGEGGRGESYPERGIRSPSPDY